MSDRVRQPPAPVASSTSRPGKQLLVGLVRSRHVSESLELAENILDHWRKASSRYRGVRPANPAAAPSAPASTRVCVRRKDTDKLLPSVNSGKSGTATMMLSRCPACLKCGKAIAIERNACDATRPAQIRYGANPRTAPAALRCPAS